MRTTIDESITMWKRYLRPSGLALLTLCFAAMLHAQTFSSGSSGADGNLNITAPGVTIFTATPIGGGNIYNFNTINIAAGSTLRLSGAVFATPLYFLAQSAVTIAGTIDLSGQSGTTPTTSAQRTAGPTVPGAGGYGGGEAAFGSDSQLPGLGPTGGTVNGGCYGGAAGGGFTGNQFLVPLVGGSGGGGSSGSGGAGGGALLIASSVSITVTGTITANGGVGASSGGGGAGGGVRLAAPTIAGTGAITAAGGGGGSYGCGSGANGIVRLEAFQYTFTGTTGGTFYFATPFGLFNPAASAQPSIMVTSIGGVTVPPSPTGSFTVPDVPLNSSSPLTINIKASNIPLGTIPTIYFSTENFPDQKITATAGLAGTLASSTTTATVTLNPGYSIGYVTATWVQ